MTFQSLSHLKAMPYHWGTMVNGKWQKKGTLIITPRGIMLDQEKLVNPSYNSTLSSLVFGDDHGTYARTGRVAFDSSQLFFHGVIEQDDGSTAHVTGFADFAATYSTIIKSIKDPGAAGKVGPTLKLTIDTTAFDGPVAKNPINFSLETNGQVENITNRVTSHDLNRVKQIFEITMGPGGPFPPTQNLFDVSMKSDMSGFEGTYEFGPVASEKYTWIGRSGQESLLTAARQVSAAEKLLVSAASPEIRNTAAASTLERLVQFDATSETADSGDNEAAILPGLDAQDLAFIAKMDAKGLKIATLDNISAVTITVDKDGKSKVDDQAQKITATVMNTATLKSLKQRWVKDFGIKPKPLDDKAEAIRKDKDNLAFFEQNADLQMGNLLKYKQDSFKGVNKAAIETISKPKLDAAWSFKSMTPERLDGYMKASSEMYGYAYAQIAQEFDAYNTKSEKEQWGRAYFHWLTDPSQLDTWQKQLNILEPDQVTVMVYEWHAKLSILAPNKPYAAAMEAYALASVISAKAQFANWTIGGIPFLAEAITAGGQANIGMKTASGEGVDNPEAPFIKERLAALHQSIGGRIVATAISDAAQAWQKSNPGASYYGYLYTTPGALDEIAKQLDGASRTAFTAWASVTPSGTQPKAEEILSYCVYAAINGVLLAGLAPKSATKATAEFVSPAGIDLPPEVAWVLKGIKIGQVVINGGATFFGIYFTQKITSLWTQYVGTISSEAPELTEALAAISSAIEDGAQISGWGLAFGARLSSVLKIAGPVLGVLGVALSAFNLAMDIMGGRPIDGIADSIGIIAGAVGVGLGIAVAFGLMTAATAGPIGLVVAGIGLLVLAFKFLWDWLFPSPTFIQLYVSGPMTKLGLVVAT